jgi:glycyl-tRNA synthetase beta chain
MDRAPLLIEIGCEEIPARMIRAAADDLGVRLRNILEQTGLGHGATTVWCGPRRLAVRLDDVEAAQSDGEELVLGPPADIAWTADGRPTRAAEGFANKQGIDPAQLERRATDKGEYVGFVRRVRGRPVGELLADRLPRAVEAMSFPKTMRWGVGRWRWVRPVHWVLALHGDRVLELELFGVRAGGWSMGHRFLSPGRSIVEHPDRYVEVLGQAHVIADPAVRRRRLTDALHRTAETLGGRLVDDEALLREVADLVEWPGTVAGRFDEGYLDLPRELLVTTLRHHQKCFSVQSAAGELLAAFVAVSNTDRDPRSHVRRGNEWVIGGRLEDARFFWNDDRKTRLVDRSPQLAGVVFHAKGGTYADKARRLEELAGGIASLLQMDRDGVDRCRRAAALAKNDLVSDTVGEFPELQGRVGGLLLLAEGEAESVGRAVYSHYQPTGTDDPIPPSPEGCVVSLADKLDTTCRLLAAGERPRGSKDPYGLRRAANGILRILVETGWPICLQELLELLAGDAGTAAFLRDRLVGFFRERDFTINEIQAVIRPRVSENEVLSWPLADFVARLEAIQTVRGRADFRSLVKLTERVDTIVVKNVEVVKTISADGPSTFEETHDTAIRLQGLVDESALHMDEQSHSAAYAGIVTSLARFVDPVEQFFADVLVIDKKNPAATRWRYGLLSRLRDLLTRYFDIRELAGQAKRRST